MDDQQGENNYLSNDLVTFQSRGIHQMLDAEGREGSNL